MGGCYLAGFLTSTKVQKTSLTAYPGMVKYAVKLYQGNLISLEVNNMEKKKQGGEIKNEKPPKAKRTASKDEIKKIYEKAVKTHGGDFR